MRNIKYVLRTVNGDYLTNENYPFDSDVKFAMRFSSIKSARRWINKNKQYDFLKIETIYVR